MTKSIKVAQLTPDGLKQTKLVGHANLGQKVFQLGFQVCRVKTVARNLTVAAEGSLERPEELTAARLETVEVLEQIREQQITGRRVAAYDLMKTRNLVESAMLAAVTGLAYTIASLLKVQTYMGYVLPLPIIISALQNGSTAAVKTTTTTFLLLFILLGPVQALTFLLMHGGFALALGICWTARVPWKASIPVAVTARVGGYLAYIKLASWSTHEDILALLVSNVHSMLDQLSSILGYSGAPSYMAVLVTIASILFVNAIIYVAMIHVLYYIVLRSMGMEISQMPAPVQRFVYRSAAST